MGVLESVGGFLNLDECGITSLGSLKTVGRWLDLRFSGVTSLGDLKTVGGWCDLRDTPISEKYTKEEIRQMVNVGGYVFLVI